YPDFYSARRRRNCARPTENLFLMTKRPTIFLDLDRTLFRTENVDQLWEFIEEKLPNINTAGAAQLAAKFYIYDGDLYCYDMGAHLVSLGLKPQQVYDLLVKKFGDGQFEYPGISELLQSLNWAEVKILT